MKERSFAIKTRTMTGWLAPVLLATATMVLAAPSSSLALPATPEAPEVTSPNIKVPLPAALRFPMPRPVWLR